MTLNFTYASLPTRVAFGSGAARTRLHDEIRELGLHRVLLIATRRDAQLAAQLCSPFADRLVAVFDGVRPHVPAEVAEAVRARAAEVEPDGILSIGGGSATGTAKILALTTGLPIVSVPTTYAGSEMTAVWGMTTRARKETGSDARVLPRSVVYDPDLTRTLPTALAVSSGLNAMAHAVEALWAPNANPVTTLHAVEAAAALAEGLRGVIPDPDESASRRDSSVQTDPHEHLLYGAYLAASAFAVAGSGLHHKICHALGGAFDLPHAQTHAVMLPHVLAFNAAALSSSDRDRLSRALDSDHCSEGLERLYRHVNAPHSLGEIGLPVTEVDRAVRAVQERLPIANPRPVTPDVVEALIVAAQAGPPASIG